MLNRLHKQSELEKRLLKNLNKIQGRLKRHPRPCQKKGVPQLSPPRFARQIELGAN